MTFTLVGKHEEDDFEHSRDVFTHHQAPHALGSWPSGRELLGEALEFFG